MLNPEVPGLWWIYLAFALSVVGLVGLCAWETIREFTRKMEEDE